MKLCKIKLLQNSVILSKKIHYLSNILEIIIKQTIMKFAKIDSYKIMEQ